MKDLKKYLKKGSRAVGSMVWGFGEPFVPLLYKNAGYDCLFIDMEHSNYTYETVQALVQTCRICDLYPFVRAPKADKECLQKIWDMGARGVIVPMMESIAQAKEFVRLSKYPPIGARGMGPFLGSMDFRFDIDINKYIKESNEQLILLVQPETQAGVDNIDDILSVDGIDGILIGPYDLSVSLGIPGKFENPVCKKAIKKLIEACQSKNKIVAAFAANPAQTREYVELKINIILRGVDTALLYSEAARTLKEIKEIKGFF